MSWTPPPGYPCARAPECPRTSPTPGGLCFAHDVDGDEPPKTTDIGQRLSAEPVKPAGQDRPRGTGAIPGKWSELPLHRA